MADLTPRLNAELAVAVAGQPPQDLADLAAARQGRRELIAGSDREIRPGAVEVSDVWVPEVDGAPAVLLRSYRPRVRNSNAPCLIWTHGGGHVLGYAGQDGVLLASLVAATGCTIYSVDPRLAPEHPFPAEVDDTYSALRWAHANAAALGIDPGRIVVGGASSGGGTSAGVVLLARDRGQVPVAHQLLIYPMLDDRNLTPSSRRITDPRVWDRDKNLLAWRHYLGAASGSDDISPYAAPSRAADLAGLPPATIFVGDCDLFLDECLDYAARLIDANVMTELRVYPGCPHGFDRIAPSSRSAREYHDDLVRTLLRAFGANAGATHA